MGVNGSRFGVTPVSKSRSNGQADSLRDMADNGEWHPDDCPCRKCRRMRKAKARRVKPRYGQQGLLSPRSYKALKG